MIFYGIAPTIDGYKQEIQQAASVGIDAFALNCNANSSTIRSRLDMMYEAAKQVNGPFRLFIDGDMEGLTSAAELRSLVQRFVDHPYQLYYQGRVLVTTFQGSRVTSGHATAAEGWYEELILPMQRSGFPIYFVPNFWEAPPGFFDKFPFVDGVFNWKAQYVAQ